MKNNIKCSFKKHSEIDAINYCKECKIYMCNKCQNLHFELFQDQEHHLYNLDKNLQDIILDFCDEKNHNQFELNYFCKTHNKLCCASCICKFEEKGNGQHRNCDVCLIENIKDEKKKILKESINNLKELQKGLEESIQELKLLFDKINNDKEELKIKIQKIFTKIRNCLNEREDALLLEIDNKFKSLFFDEEIIKKTEKLPNKIKNSLEKEEMINKILNESNIKVLIHNCLNFENDIKEINELKENIQKCNSNKNISINFIPEKNEDIDKILKIINNFGNISSSTGDGFNFNVSDSSIINSSDEINFIIETLKNKEYFKNKNLQLTLIFKATKDGQNSSDFHKKCDGKEHLLVFLKTTKGLIFGGYTKEGYKSRNSQIVDNQAFIFSITKKKIYHIKYGKNAICDKTIKGPCFSGSFSFIINIEEKMFGNSNTCPISNSYYEGITMDYELNNGEKIFILQEIEVYQLI